MEQRWERSKLPQRKAGMHGVRALRGSITDTIFLGIAEPLTLHKRTGEDVNAGG
jgi:hypothetical protein